jgi:serine/threonine-protein kinase SRPK3
LRFWSLNSVLKEKYLMELNEAEQLSSFLMMMLNYHSETRASAAELLKHPWLAGVVVFGELELAEVERARLQAEVERRGAQSSEAGAEAVGSSVVPEEQKKKRISLEEVKKLGPAVKGLVGMGRI